MIIDNPLNLIGNTPLYKLKDLNIYLKLEKFNLGGSIKDRAALGMIEDAEKKGYLREDSINRTNKWQYRHWSCFDRQD